MKQRESYPSPNAFFCLGDTSIPSVLSARWHVLPCLAIINYDKMINRDHPPIYRAHSHCGIISFCHTLWTVIDQRPYSSWGVRCLLLYCRRVSGDQLNFSFGEVQRSQVTRELCSGAQRIVSSLECFFFYCWIHESWNAHWTHTPKLNCSLNAHTRAEMLTGRTHLSWLRYSRDAHTGAEMLTERTHQSWGAH